MINKKGRFITLEGPEGSGKTTISLLVKEKLEKDGFNVLLTREPGGIDISEKIRNIILDVEHTNMDYKTEALLYAAARRQHLVEKVNPHIEKGYIVICDRFLHSSLAYQGVGRGLGIEEVMKINEFAIGDTFPDKTIYFDIDPEIGLERINSDKDREINRLDKEKIDFHHKIRNAYLGFCDDEKFIKIDASKGIKEVFENVYQEIINSL